MADTHVPIASIDPSTGQYVMVDFCLPCTYSAIPSRGFVSQDPLSTYSDRGREADRLRQERNELKDELALAKREIEHKRAALESLQDSALSSVDRFSPLPDGMIEEQFLILASKITALGNFLARGTKSDIENRKWTTTMVRRAWPYAYNDAKLDPKKDSSFRKLLWRLVLWSWIDDAVVRDPFQAFGGSPAQTMHEAYNALFPVARKPDDWKNGLFFPSEYCAEFELQPFMLTLCS
jgi:hypothetical protein